jgi:hypothetical protein
MFLLINMQLNKVERHYLLAKIKLLSLFCTIFFSLSFLSYPILAQQDPEIVTIMGRAEILSSGTWREAKTGEFVKPGDWIRIVGEGEVKLSEDHGKTSITLQDETSVRFDGVVDPNSRPWQNGLPVSNAAAKPDPEGESTIQYTLPYGKADIEVVPGQPLRVVTPLIAAAVRGTHFLLAVALDGSSTLSTIEGQVLALGRNGISQIVGAGSTMQLTSSQYAGFLQQGGVNVPGGDWQGLDLSTLEKVDAQTFSDTFTTSASEASSGSTTASQVSSTTTSTTTTTPASTSASTSASAATTSTAGSTATSAVTGAIAQAAPSVGSAAAMGTAGVTTGTLNAEKMAAQPLADAGPLPGNLEILDALGNPTSNFVTDEKGQFVMKVQPQSEGEKVVILTIGGEKYRIDLDEGTGSGGAGFEVTFDYVNFNSIAAEYESTATITPYFDGKTPTGPVSWSVVNIQNPDKPWWLRGANDPNGLTWGPTAAFVGYDGYTNWATFNFILGTIPQGPVAQLTDVVGNRIVTVKAETTIDGVLHSRTVDVHFGDGPLSVFTSAPSAVSLQWARSAGNAATAGVYNGNFLALDGSSSADFPAAVGYCGGSVNVGAITSTTTSIPHSATFDTSPNSGWILAPPYPSYNQGYYSTTSRLPTYAQLDALGSCDYPSCATGSPRRAAGSAANWIPLSGGIMTGIVNMEYDSFNFLTHDFTFGVSGWNLTSVIYPDQVICVSP